MKYYHATQTEQGSAIVVEEDGEFRALNPRHDLQSISPDGFQWGNHSDNGTAQLALALAADVLGDDGKAQRVYQRLQLKLIAVLPPEGWVLAENRVRDIIDGIERERHSQRRV